MTGHNANAGSPVEGHRWFWHKRRPERWRAELSALRAAGWSYRISRLRDGRVGLSIDYPIIQEHELDTVGSAKAFGSDTDDDKDRHLPKPPQRAGPVTVRIKVRFPDMYPWFGPDFYDEANHLGVTRHRESFTGRLCLLHDEHRHVDTTVAEILVEQMPKLLATRRQTSGASRPALTEPGASGQLDHQHAIAEAEKQRSDSTNGRDGRLDRDALMETLVAEPLHIPYAFSSDITVPDWSIPRVGPGGGVDGGTLAVLFATPSAGGIGAGTVEHIGGHGFDLTTPVPRSRLITHFPLRAVGRWLRDPDFIPGQSANETVARIRRRLDQVDRLDSTGTDHGIDQDDVELGAKGSTRTLASTGGQAGRFSWPARRSGELLPSGRGRSSRVAQVTIAADRPRSTSKAAGSDSQPIVLPQPLDAATFRAVSLFSGIAGLDSGMESAGGRVVEMCESWEPARRVLRARYPDVEVAPDVAGYIPGVPFSVLAAGFPCTDLSHAGSKAGIFGPQSGLVDWVFRIAARTQPEWIVLENVPNLLTLHAGAGITEVVDRLEALGYSWAYRTVDSRFTGVPQRRYRVIVLASHTHDPTGPLLGEDARPPALPGSDALTPTRRVGAKEQPPRSWRPHGFYWTEGRTGLGLVEGAIPTLKGGSTLGTPSAPAVWFPDAPRGRRFVLPRIEDGEQLQGLPRGWTEAAVVEGERDLRWKLLGNAVTKGVGSWIGDRIGGAGSGLRTVEYATGRILERNTRWPKAAAGGPGRPAVEVLVSDHPRELPMTSLEDIVDVTEAPPLSHRATRGFLSRVDEKTRDSFDKDLYADLESHLAHTLPKFQPLPQGSWAASPSSRARMQAQKQKDTKPELRMRRELTALGLRYQLQRRPEPDLRSRMDILFKGAKVAVDIRGCFWHSCPEHGTKPRPNPDRWAEKLRRNKERDDQSVQALTERGWYVHVVWEHDDPAVEARKVAALVESRRKKSGQPRGGKA